MSMNNIQKLTAEQKELLLSKSPYVLPDNPSDKHFSPSQIRKKMYEGLLVLYDYINLLIDAVNSNVTLSNTDIATINTNLTTLFSYFTNGIAKKATADADNNVITVTYETKADATTKFNTNKNEIDKIKDGTTVASKAKSDESGNNIKATYGASMTHDLVASESALVFKINLVNKNGEIIDTETQTFDSASTAVAGLLSVADKVKINNIASDIATALNGAKAYADNLVLRTNLVSVLGEASTSLNGLMSANDKAHLEALYALLGDSSDADSVVNTINEVLAIFNQYPEGADLVSALALKVNISDIVDDLVTENAGKPLSAKQGKILKGLIDTLTSTKANASDVYKKEETYSRTQSDDKFRTESQVDDQINEKLANVSALNVIADEDNDKNYTYQIKIQNGKAHLIATEVE